MELDVLVAELNGKLERMVDGIEVVKERQETMAVDIAKIKEIVYNPEGGIYARLKELENWKKTQSKMTWFFITTLSGLLGVVFDSLVDNLFK